MTQDTECFRYVTCVRVLSRVRAKFIFRYNCKIFTFFWTCKYYLYICIVVLCYSFFDVLPPLINSLFCGKILPPTLPLNLLVISTITIMLNYCK